MAAVVQGTPWVDRWQELGRPGPIFPVSQRRIHLLVTRPHMFFQHVREDLLPNNDFSINPTGKIEVFLKAEQLLQEALANSNQATQSEGANRSRGYVVTAICVTLIACGIFSAIKGSLIAVPFFATYVFLSLCCGALAYDSYETTRGMNADSSSSISNLILAFALGPIDYLKAQLTLVQRWRDAIEDRTTYLSEVRDSLNQGFSKLHDFYINNDAAIRDRIKKFPQESSPEKDDGFFNDLVQRDADRTSHHPVPLKTEQTIEAFKAQVTQVLDIYIAFLQRIGPAP